MEWGRRDISVEGVRLELYPLWRVLWEVQRRGFHNCEKLLLGRGYHLLPRQGVLSHPQKRGATIVENYHLGGGVEYHPARECCVVPLLVPIAPHPVI